MGRSAAVLAIGVMIGAGLGHANPDQVRAQQKPTVQVVYRADLENLPGQETIFEVLTVPPGLSTPRHVHPDGHEIVYVLQGSTSAEIEGRETRVHGVGEVLHIAPNVPHVGRNASKSEPLKVLIVRIRDKAKPIMVPVK